MSTADSQTILWLVSTLFWVGVMLVPLGLVLLLAPGKAIKLADCLNRWISTQAFFDAINKPRYHEKHFYRHHHLLGASIVILASFSIYMLMFYVNMDTAVAYFMALAKSEFERWLFVNFYYLLVIMLFIALAVGVVIFSRPSALKKLETWSNQWISTEEKLHSLDEMHDLPGNILSERPRLFGLFILFGAAYIMYMTIGPAF